MTAPRAFERDGFLRRAGPFAGATLAGLVLLLVVGPHRDLVLLGEAAGYVMLVWALAYAIPWTRLPAWLEIVPPLLLLLPVAALRRPLGGAIAPQTVAPFFLVPVFWISLYGTRAQLVGLLAVVVLLRLIPILVDQPAPGEVGYASAALVVTATVCLLTHEVVRRARDAERALRTVLDALPVGFAIHQRGRVVYANRKAAALLGATSPADLIGEVMDGDGGGPVDRRLAHRGGGEVVLEVDSVALRFANAPALGAVMRDVTDERLLASAEQAMHDRVAHERAQLAAILANVNDGVAMLDGQRRGVLANPAYLALFGLDERTFVGMDRAAFAQHAATLVARPDELAAALADSADEALEITFTRPRRRIMRRTMRPMQRPDGAGFLVVWHDVTADHDLVAEREQQALIDKLTGLPNRRAAEEALDRAVARARRTGEPLCVALFDLDRFKRINDEHGHEAGDRVLAATARVLAAHARGSDVVARWGGEEFVAILPAPLAGGRAYAERVRAALAEADLEREIAGVGAITISAGLALWRDGEDVAQTLARADRALYDAKRDGRDRVAG